MQRDSKVIEGIELTPEILVKAGFVFNSEVNTYDKVIEHGLLAIDIDDKSFFIGDSHEECGFAGNTKSALKSVHQLQNLFFSLCGEELEIKL